MQHIGGGLVQLDSWKNALIWKKNAVVFWA